VPASAVIPALQAYVEVVVLETPVVDGRLVCCLWLCPVHVASSDAAAWSRASDGTPVSIGVTGVTHTMGRAVKCVDPHRMTYGEST